jgi:hypothetical protein
MTEELRFGARRGKSVWLLFITIVLGAGCILFVLSGIYGKNIFLLIIGVLAVLFCLFGIIIFIIQIISPNRFYLKLTKEGIEMNSSFRSNLFRWEDIEKFRPGKTHGAKMIAVDFKPNYLKQKLGREISMNLSGFEAAIPDNYNVNLEELIVVLERWRKKYSR